MSGLGPLRPSGSEPERAWGSKLATSPRSSARPSGQSPRSAAPLMWPASPIETDGQRRSPARRCARRGVQYGSLSLSTTSAGNGSGWRTIGRHEYSWAACRRVRYRAARPAARRRRARACRCAPPTPPTSWQPRLWATSSAGAGRLQQHFLEPRHPVAAPRPEPVVLLDAHVAVAAAPSGFANGRGRSFATRAATTYAGRAVIAFPYSS